MKTQLLLLLAWLSSGAVLAQTGLPYKAGVGTANITPCTPSMTNCKADYIQLSADVRNTGGNANILTTVDSDLEVRVLLLEDAQGQRLALVTLDVLAFPASFTATVRQQLTNPSLHLGLTADHIILNASHTHNAPSLLDLSSNNSPAPDGSTTGIPTEDAPNAQYVAGVQGKIVAAAQQATQNLEPVSLAVGTAPCLLATYRRFDSKVPNGQPYPQRLDVLQARNVSGQLVALAYFFACHSTTMIVAGAFSSDYPGKSRQVVEARLHTSSPQVKALFFQGFAGDLNTGQIGTAARDTAGEVIGRQVSQISAKAPLATLQGSFSVATRLLALPVDPVAVQQNWNTDGASTLPVEIAQVQVLNTAAVPWTFLFCSHEVVSEYAANVRSTYDYPAFVTLAGYSNFSNSYLPTQRMQLTDLTNCGLLPNGYEGCYSFRLYGHGRPTWQDDAFYAHQQLPRDDFDASAQNTDKWIQHTYVRAAGQAIFDGQVSARQQNGRLEIQPLASSSNLSYNGFSTVQAYNFTGQQASVEVVQVPNVVGVEFMFYLVRDPDNYYAFNIQQGQLRADKHVAGAVTYYPLGTFNPTLHRYLRLRHEAATGKLLWEASADGQAWTSLFDQVQEMPLTAMHLELVGGSYQATGSAAPILLDNFRVLDDLFTDDFDASAQNTDKWIQHTYVRAAGQAIFDGQVSARQQNGRLEIQPLTNSSGLSYNGFSTVQAYNFTGQQASVEVVQVPNVVGVEFMFYLVRDPDNYYAFNIQQGQLRADKHVAGAVTYYPLGTFNPTLHRYLRLRHEATTGKLLWEVSADGQAWASLFDQVQEMPLTAMHLELVGGSYQATGSSAPILLDNFRIPTQLNNARQPIILSTATAPTTSSWQPSAYPNPFTGTTTISYSLAHEEQVTLIVYDALGHKVATLLDELQAAGSHLFVYDAHALSTGLYICRIVTARNQIGNLHLLVN